MPQWLAHHGVDACCVAASKPIMLVGKWCRFKMLLDGSGLWQSTAILCDSTLCKVERYQNGCGAGFNLETTSNKSSSWFWVPVGCVFLDKRGCFNAPFAFSRHLCLNTSILILGGRLADARSERLYAAGGTWRSTVDVWWSSEGCAKLWKGETW